MAITNTTNSLNTNDNKRGITMDGSSLSASDVAMLAGNNDGFGNNGLWLFAILALMGGGFGGWGYGNRDFGYQPQYATQDFVQNGFNFNDIQDQNRDLMNAINSGSAQAVAATNQAKYDNINVAKDIQNSIISQIGDIKANQQAMMSHQSQCCTEQLRAIDNAKFEAAQNTALINANISEKTQKILDTLTGNQMAMMRDQIQSLQMQNMLNGVVRYPTSSAYSAGNSPFCNCGNYGCCCGN